MINRNIIGMVFPAHSVVVESGQLRFFAKAIGETNPIYFDEAAARDAGHPTLPVPPTFFFSLELTRKETNWREEAGIQLPRVLHGEQAFTYHRMAYAGDTLHFESRVTDVYDKKDGALTFVAMESRITNQRGEHVADVRKSLVHRNG